MTLQGGVCHTLALVMASTTGLKRRYEDSFWNFESLEKNAQRYISKVYFTKIALTLIILLAHFLSGAFLWEHLKNKYFEISLICFAVVFIVCLVLLFKINISSGKGQIAGVVAWVLFGTSLGILMGTVYPKRAFHRFYLVFYLAVVVFFLLEAVIVLLLRNRCLILLASVGLAAAVAIATVFVEKKLFQNDAYYKFAMGSPIIGISGGLVAVFTIVDIQALANIVESESQNLILDSVAFFSDVVFVFAHMLILARRYR